MNVTYERILQLFLIAHSDSRIIDAFAVHETPLTIMYSDYVKSQLHLNAVSSFYSVTRRRNIFEYAKALEFRGCTESTDILLRRYFKVFNEK